jgi:hypothetical protein
MPASEPSANDGLGHEVSLIGHAPACGPPTAARTHVVCRDAERGNARIGACSAAAGIGILADSTPKRDWTVKSRRGPFEITLCFLNLGKVQQRHTRADS